MKPLIQTSKSFLARSLVALAASLLAPTILQAGDWPHWMGPNGDNKSAAANSFNPDFSQWKVAWSTNIGPGYSSVAVANGRAIVMGHNRESEETVYCFDAKTGALNWKHSYKAELMPLMHEGGPNATATIIGDAVITLGKDGQVHRLAAANGKPAWSVKLTEATGVPVPRWGFASSPVVSGKEIILAAGKIITLDLETGKTVWVSTNDYPAGYTSAVVFDRTGQKYIAALDGKGLSIFSFDKHAEVARHPFKAMFDVVMATPIVLGEGRIFIASNIGSELVAFDGKTLSGVWAGTEMKNSLNNSVVFGETLYGIDFSQQGPASRFVALDLKDGKPKWVKPAFGFGTTMGVGSVVVALTENGELVDIKTGGADYDEISRRQILGKTCWTTPVYANERLYARNSAGELVCLSPN
jgi:outer membrane protein assembly factor BamB